ncbi:MAG: penicillin acylase family protein [Myxococcota bacterium]
MWDDEGIASWRYSGTREEVTALIKFLDDRGTAPTGHMASWNAATGEAVFFDVLGTPEVERSDELMLGTLADALAYLAGPSPGPGLGGFATADMSRVAVGPPPQIEEFESVILTFAGQIDAVRLLFADYSITTARIPLADHFEPGDPRNGLEWFARGGGQWASTYGQPGFSSADYTAGSGPAMRIVYALDGAKTTGKFICRAASRARHRAYDDQLRLWLANDAYPIRFSASDVAAGTTRREVYVNPLNGEHRCRAGRAATS